MRYRIEELLGAGGMGQVYRARDLRLDRTVAVKYLRGTDPEQVERILREARAQARVRHEGVCEVYEAGQTEDGKAFVAMRFVAGQTLAGAAAGMTLRDKVEAVQRVADAVQAAHNHGLVHRDLKPGNVMVERNDDGDWVPYVVDFGLAVELEADGESTQDTLRGTPAYMAPEQLRGGSEARERQVDIYALGATLYEMLAGRRPFDGDSAVELWMRVLQEPPPPLRKVAPEVPEDLATIVHKCLAKDPGRRYGSARLLAEDLERFLAGEPVLARPPSLTYLLGKWVRRHRLVAGLAGLLVVAALVGWAKYSFDLTRERAEAVAQRQRAEAALAEAEEMGTFLVDLFQVADPTESHGEDMTVRELVARGGGQVDQGFADRPLVRARLQHALGAVHANLGLHDEARRLLEAAKATRQTLLPELDPRRADSLFELGKLDFHEGYLEDAFHRFEMALDMREQLFGRDHVAVAQVLSWLGHTERKVNRPDMSEAHLLEAIAIFRRQRGAEAVELAAPLSNLGLNLQARGRFDEAEARFLEALAIRERHQGPDHGLTGVVLNNLGALATNMGDHQRAADLLRRALEIREKTLSPDHPRLTRSINNLAVAMWELGEVEEVEALLERCLTIQEASLPADHYEIAVTLNNLGELAWTRGRLDRAEHLYRRAVAIKEKTHGVDHPRTATSLMGLGHVLRDQDRRDEAASLYRRALAIRETSLDPDHPAIVESREALAEVDGHS